MSLNLHTDYLRDCLSTAIHAGIFEKVSVQMYDDLKRDGGRIKHTDCIIQPDLREIHPPTV